MMSTGIPNTNEVQPEQKVLLTGSAFFVSGQDAWDVSLLKDRTLDTPLQKRRVLHKECYNAILQLRSSLCNTVQNVRQSGL